MKSKNDKNGGVKPLFTEENIPAELKLAPRWVCWGVDRNAQKRPWSVVKHDWASTTDPSTWAPYEVARTAALAGGWGLGFMLGDGFAGVDFDNVIQGGEILANAGVRIQELSSYTERSPSGKGFHTFLLGDLGGEGGYNRKRDKGEVTQHGYEVYDTDRYFTVTGDHLAWTPREVLDRGDNIRNLLEGLKREEAEEAEAELQEWKRPNWNLPDFEFTEGDSALQFYVLIRETETFYYNGSVAVLIRGRLREFTPENFAGSCDVLVRPVKRSRRKDGSIATNAGRVTMALAKSVLHSFHADEYLPRLSRVLKSPMLVDQGGELEMLRDGFYEAGGGTLVIPEGEEPVAFGSAEEARDVLLGGPLADFKFRSPGDRARAFAGLLTPAFRFGGLLRGDGRAPIFIEEADQSQTGKTLMARVRAAIYGEHAKDVTQKVGLGGVGSTDENVATALASGHPFLNLDNFRGKVASTMLESFLTAESKFTVRVPYKGPVVVDPAGYILTLTSNAFAATRDLANRACVTKILKHGAGYEFRKYAEGSLDRHVRELHHVYLGAVYTIIRWWDEQGRPRLERDDHDFREWAGILGWITENLGLGDLLEGHELSKARAENPLYRAIDEVGKFLAEHDLLGVQQTSAELVNHLCELDLDGELGLGRVEYSGEDRRHKRLTWKLKSIFEDTTEVNTGNCVIQRYTVSDSRGNKSYRYAFFCSN